MLKRPTVDFQPPHKGSAPKGVNGVWITLYFPPIDNPDINPGDVAYSFNHSLRRTPKGFFIKSGFGGLSSANNTPGYEWSNTKISFRCARARGVARTEEVFIW